MNSCVFCKIIQKELPATIIFEDDDFLAFLPIDQASKGHTLLIPKQHYENIFDIDTTLFEKINRVAQKLARELVVTHEASGINLLHASGGDAQQSVFHFHLHIVPRYKDDKLDLWFRNKL